MEDDENQIQNFADNFYLVGEEFDQVLIDQILQRGDEVYNENRTPSNASDDRSSNGSAMPNLISLTVSDDEDDDVVFVGQQAVVIDLCSPPISRSPVPQYTNHRKIGSSDAGCSMNDVTEISEESSKKEIENTVTCPICLSSTIGRSPHSTKCGHVFCGNCIKESIKNSKKCPLCNKPVSSKQIHPIYI